MRGEGEGLNSRALIVETNNNRLTSPILCGRLNQTKFERQLSQVPSIPSIPVTKVALDNIVPVVETMVDSNEFGKHVLSSSESESEDGESGNEREDLLDKIVASSKLQACLGFLKDEIKADTDAPVKDEIKRTKRKRVKRQLDFDLKDVVDTLLDDGDYYLTFQKD